MVRGVGLTAVGTHVVYTEVKVVPLWWIFRIRDTFLGLAIIRIIVLSVHIWAPVFALNPQTPKPQTLKTQNPEP